MRSKKGLSIFGCLLISSSVFAAQLDINLPVPLTANTLLPEPLSTLPATKSALNKQAKVVLAENAVLPAATDKSGIDFSNIVEFEGPGLSLDGYQLPQPFSTSASDKNKKANLKTTPKSAAQTIDVIKTQPAIKAAKQQEPIKPVAIDKAVVQAPTVSAKPIIKQVKAADTVTDVSLETKVVNKTESVEASAPPATNNMSNDLVASSAMELNQLVDETTEQQSVEQELSILDEISEPKKSFNEPQITQDIAVISAPTKPKAPKSSFENTIENLFSSDDEQQHDRRAYDYEDSLLANSEDNNRGLEILDGSLKSDSQAQQLLGELEALSTSYQKAPRANRNDNCLTAIINNQKSPTATAKCQDSYLDEQLAPELVIVNNANDNKLPVYAITKRAISEREFYMYCLLSGECPNVKQAPLQAEDFSQPETALPIGLDLADIENSVHEYNKYCAISGKCPGMFAKDESKALKNISYNQAMSYANWLSQQTGHKYRMPTQVEWLSALEDDDNKICKNWLQSSQPADKGTETTTSRFGAVLTSSTPEEWVWTGNNTALLGLKRNNITNCQLKIRSLASNNKATDAGFRLVREISQ